MVHLRQGYHHQSNLLRLLYCCGYYVVYRNVYACPCFPYEFFLVQPGARFIHSSAPLDPHEFSKL
jgi:hypothetical protein